MPAHSFMLSDLTGSMAAVCLFPLFLVAPGLVAGWWTGLYDCRRRTGAFEWVLSIPLSLAVCPILTYLVGRFVGMPAVWAMYGATWIAAAALFVRRDLGIPRLPRAAWWIGGVWAAIAIASLVDLQVGTRT